ncbi:hypothetical protein BDS110ZK4_86970 [Bradyrhizobium diazoefficiens]|jgi:hypothetical protein|nr:hypothetical protein GCM10007858_11840 [Bradyrhizobium liaoningense]
MALSITISVKVCCWGRQRDVAAARCQKDPGAFGFAEQFAADLKDHRMRI